MNNNDLLPLLREEIIKNNPDQLWVFENLLISHLGGSHPYGTNNPDSDIDIIGITYAPKDYWIGAKKFESYRITFHNPKIDVIIYDIRRWM